MVDEKARAEPALEPLSSFATRARVDPAGFASFCPEAVFVVAPFDQLDGGFNTVNMSANALLRGDAGPQVARLRKRAGANAFSHMITIGRASNNDVQLKAEGVSKFHAYVAVDPGSGAVTITDAGSTYGTTVQGQPVTKQAKVELKDGDEVVLGNRLRMQFFTPAGLLSHLQAGGA